MNAQDDGQIQCRGRREGSHGYHERVRWLELRNPRSNRGLNDPLRKTPLASTAAGFLLIQQQVVNLLLGLCQGLIP